MSHDVWQWQIHIKGHVQGVGFRAAVAKQAVEYSIVGYVKNCSDGAVDICAQARESDLELFLKAIRERPGRGTIEQIHVERKRPQPRFSSFEVKD